MSSNIRILIAILLCVVTMGFLLPTSIAIARDHPDVASIAVWNTLGMLLFGLGWLIALVKAVGTSASQQQTTIVVQNVVHAERSTKDLA